MKIFSIPIACTLIVLCCVTSVSPMRRVFMRTAGTNMPRVLLPVSPPRLSPLFGQSRRDAVLSPVLFSCLSQIGGIDGVSIISPMNSDLDVLYRERLQAVAVPKYLQHDYLASLIYRFVATGMHIDDRDSAGRTLLHWAIRHGSIVAVAYLIDSGAHVMAEDDSGNGAYYYLRELRYRNRHEQADAIGCLLDDAMVMHRMMSVIEASQRDSQDYDGTRPDDRED